MIVPTRDETELRDYIIGNLYWLGTASREKAAAWLDDAIATHTRQRAESAEDEARLQRTQVDQHKEALALADKRIAELEAKLDAAKLACAEAAERALQAAPDYEAMHAMVRSAIMQAGNGRTEATRSERVASSEGFATRIKDK
jgi:chromosome segregation ATPase